MEMQPTAGTGGDSMVDPSPKSSPGKSWLSVPHGMAWPRVTPVQSMGQLAWRSLEAD